MLNFLKYFSLIYLILLNKNAYAYIDPVTTGIIYQILFFLVAGALAFFLRIKKLILYLNYNYKYAQHFLLVICLFPYWAIVSDLSGKELSVVFIIFFFIPLVIIYVVKLLISFFNIAKFNIFLISIVTVYGLDQSFSFASVINILRIMDDVYRYSGYLLLLIILIFFVNFIYVKNIRIINLFILIIIFSNTYNFIINEKNIKNINSFELIENDISSLQIDKNYQENRPVIIIILDEMNGLKALNDKIPNTNETIINTDSLFSKYNFTHYPNAYSIYASTADSIPSTLNFHYNYNYDKMKNYRKPHNDSFAFYEKLTSNKLFDLYDPNKIYIYQNLGLDICSYDNFKTCKTINPFSKNYKYINKFKFNSLDAIFSKYSYQTSIFSILLTRTLRYFDLIKIIEPRLIGKVTVEHVLNEIFEKSISKKYSLILAHLMAPHKPFAWNKDDCSYKYYQNPNFLTDNELQEFHNIEIQCMNKFLDVFFNKLENNNLLNFYDIVLFSDHGARNLRYDDNKIDWYSALYAERKKDGSYNKIEEMLPTQLLFYNFFNENKASISNYKINDLKTNSYINIDKIFN